MIYSRRLVRELPGGESFSVERRFMVRIEQFGAGFQVIGEQTGVEVAAPPQLQRFAEIERGRHEAGLFPITLDHRGLIADSSVTRDQVALDAAVLAVRSTIANLAYRPEEREQIEAYVKAVHQTASGLITELPADLFAPVEAERRLNREVRLPTGESGHIRSSFSATVDPATGLMRQASREVVSEMAGDRRRILESWKLTPQA